jgi:hypothetical protein
MRNPLYKLSVDENRKSITKKMSPLLYDSLFCRHPQSDHVVRLWLKAWVLHCNPRLPLKDITVAPDECMGVAREMFLGRHCMVHADAGSRCSGFGSSTAKVIGPCSFIPA